MPGLLLDTHILLDLLGTLGDPPPGFRWATGAALFVSVASLWEVAIKVRQGKVGLQLSVAELAPQVEQFGCTVLPVQSSHATAEVDPWPDTQDPFDRLLLAVCAGEDLRLVTRDTKLVHHPLAWRPASA